MKKISLSLVVIFSIFGIYFVASPTTNALSSQDFNPGRIIDDSVFYNKNAMNGSQGVQDFLNTHVPACDTWGTGPSGYGGLTRAQYAQQMGWQGPPYACLQNYHENPTTRETSFEKGGGAFAGGQSAAQIIWDASQEYGINPQVLIVMLRKESAGPLTADNWPLKSQYKYAMGYGCPDSGPGYSANCATDKGGFYNQVRLAAWQLRYYANNINTYNYRPNRTNYIQYNPDPSCGGKNVFIENIATASLYIYTPYVPNDAALNAYPGTATCGAYGNRNFFAMFNEWFGSTMGGGYTWETVNLTLYDAGKNTILSADTLHQGEQLLASLKVRNTSGITWNKDGVTPTVLGTDGPRDRNSLLCDNTWLKCNRAAKLVEPSVAPGAEGHFEFYLKANDTPGEYRDYLTPVIENRGWMTQAPGFHIYTKTIPDYAWQWDTLNAWSDPARTLPKDLSNVTRGEKLYIDLRIKNTSATTWYNTGEFPLRLGTDGPKDRRSGLCDSAWISCNRISTVEQARVLPGQTAVFKFSFNAPTKLGTHREYIRPLIEGKGWMANDNNHIYLNVTQ